MASIEETPPIPFDREPNPQRMTVPDSKPPEKLEYPLSRRKSMAKTALSIPSSVAVPLQRRHLRLHANCREADRLTARADVAPSKYSGNPVSFPRLPIDSRSARS